MAGRWQELNISADYPVTGLPGRESLRPRIVGIIAGYVKQVILDTIRWMLITIKYNTAFMLDIRIRFIYLYIITN